MKHGYYQLKLKVLQQTVTEIMDLEPANQFMTK